MSVVVRIAAPDEVDAILDICEGAKAIMRESGNPHQWSSAYPDRSCIASDIDAGHGYVCCDEVGSPVAYFAFMPGPEPTYSEIHAGHWVDDRRPYHVIHRLAKLHGTGGGVFDAVIGYCATVSPNLRVDTHADNSIMRHCFAKHGFVYCGIIYLSDGSERLAYQRLCPDDDA